jgi:hypothetical protein
MAIPGTRPAHRVHVPQPSRGPLPDPGGADSVMRAFRRQLQVAQAYHDYRNSIPAGVDPDELKDAAGVFAYTDPALQLQPALDAVREDSKAATKDVAEAVKSAVVGDDQHGAATRIWARVKDRLDRAKTVSDKVAVAQDLIAHADGLELATLRDELPFYLTTEARNAGAQLPSVTDWIESAVAGRIPAASAAVAKAATLAKQHDVLLANHLKLRRAMEHDVAVPELLDPAQYGN